MVWEVRKYTSNPPNIVATKNTYPVKFDKCVLTWINIINEFVFQYPWITQHAWHLPLPPCKFCNLSSNRNLNDRTTGSDQLIILSGGPLASPKMTAKLTRLSLSDMLSFSWCSTNPKTNVHPGNGPGPKTKSIIFQPLMFIQGLLLLIFSKPWSK